MMKNEFGSTISKRAKHKTERVIVPRFFCVLALMNFAALSVAEQDLKPDKSRVNPKGIHSFSQPAANMPLMRRLDFSVGNSFFRNPWVVSPASTDARDGLGPLFNTNACQNCHIKDGRGHLPQSETDNAVSLLLRLNVSGNHQLAPHEANKTDPNYGGQLQDFGIPGVPAEGQIKIEYDKRRIRFADGSEVELQKPRFSLVQLAYGNLHPKTQVSARIAPVMVGLGLLEAVADETLVALADPHDSNRDGISGRLNRVWSVESQSQVNGRFGWKAGQPSLKQQNAAAFNGDMGIRSSLFPSENCTATQILCNKVSEQDDLNRPGSEIEISDTLLDQVTFYTSNLAVPKRRRPQDKNVVAGERLFNELNCSACHVPQVSTSSNYKFNWLANTRINPYSDLLLHDMGSELDDGSSEFLATGSEWRTPPLWGLGMIKSVNGIEALLRDGRARNAEEAILWHGGEAEAAKQAYLKLSKNQREQMMAFLYDL